MEELQVPGPKTHMRLSTMHGTHKVATKKFSGLQIHSLHDNSCIPLPVTFGMESIPANMSHMPKKSSVSPWPHLHHLRKYLLDDDVHIRPGLLIGLDCSPALKILEFTPQPLTNPQAIKTPLG